MTDMEREVLAVIAARIAVNHGIIHPQSIAAMAVMQLEAICQHGWLGIAWEKFCNTGNDDFYDIGTNGMSPAEVREILKKAVEDQFLLNGWIAKDENGKFYEPR